MNAESKSCGFVDETRSWAVEIVGLAEKARNFSILLEYCVGNKRSLYVYT